MLITFCAAVDIEVMGLARCFVGSLIVCAVLFAALSSTVRATKLLFLRQKVIWCHFKLPMSWTKDTDFRPFVLILHDGVVGVFQDSCH